MAFFTQNYAFLAEPGLFIMHLHRVDAQSWPAFLTFKGIFQVISVQDWARGCAPCEVTQAPCLEFPTLG